MGVMSVKKIHALTQPPPVVDLPQVNIPEIVLHSRESNDSTSVLVRYQSINVVF